MLGEGYAVLTSTFAWFCLASKAIKVFGILIMYNNNLPTPQEMVENLLNQMIYDLDNGSYKVVCTQLPELWDDYKEIIRSVYHLYSKYYKICLQCTMYS